MVLSLRIRAPTSAGHGEYHSLLLFSVLGMAVLVSAQDLVTLFIGFELLSIPLYILCASEFRREGSLESGLKYLVIGSVGSATLVYGLALVYGATGSTDFTGIANAIAQGQLAGGLLGDPMMLTGLALVIVGFAFKASVAPFHQWTPDVYEGAPDPDHRLHGHRHQGRRARRDPALLRRGRDRRPGHLGAGLRRHRHDHDRGRQRRRAGPVLAEADARLLERGPGRATCSAGVVVGTQLGVEATVLYLIVYLFMNIAAFAVIVAEQNERADGDDDLRARRAGRPATRGWPGR